MFPQFARRETPTAYEYERYGVRRSVFEGYHVWLVTILRRQILVVFPRWVNRIFPPES